MPNDIPAPEILEWMGVQYKTILATAATGGALSITDSVSPPLSGPAPACASGRR